MKQAPSNPYRFLFRRFAIWFKGSVSFLWLFFVAAYLMFLAGHAFYRNYQSQEETKVLQNTLIADREERERLQALIVYYQTDSFKEKELRRTLLLKGKDEVVYALPESSVAKTVEEAISQSSSTGKKAPSTLSIWEQWSRYFMYGERG